MIGIANMPNGYDHDARTLSHILLPQPADLGSISARCARYPKLLSTA